MPIKVKAATRAGHLAGARINQELRTRRDLLTTASRLVATILFNGTQSATGSVASRWSISVNGNNFRPRRGCCCQV